MLEMRLVCFWNEDRHASVCKSHMCTDSSANPMARMLAFGVVRMKGRTRNTVGFGNDEDKVAVECEYAKTKIDGGHSQIIH